MTAMLGDKSIDQDFNAKPDSEGSGLGLVLGIKGQGLGLGIRARGQGLGSVNSKPDSEGSG